MRYLAILGIVILLIFTGCTDKVDSEKLLDELSAKNDEISMLEEELSSLEAENEDLRIQLDDVERINFNHYHFMETVNDNVYMILESGDSKNDTFLRRLVRYTCYEDPFVIYESRGLDFRVGPNEEILAVDHSGDYESKVSFVDNEGELLYDMEFPQFEDKLTPRLYGWSYDGRYFWGTMQWAYMVEMYFIVDTKDWNISYIDNVKNYSHEKVINC
jgi:cell division protein FtsB